MVGPVGVGGVAWLGNRVSGPSRVEALCCARAMARPRIAASKWLLDAMWCAAHVAAEFSTVSRNGPGELPPRLPGTLGTVSLTGTDRSWGPPTSSPYFERSPGLLNGGLSRRWPVDNRVLVDKSIRAAG